MSAEIGIIMPCYYSSEIIKKAFIALSKQTRKDAIELIMINDCSPNTDCDYQDLRDEFANQFNIKYLKTNINSGPGVARQLGLDNCNTPWVMFHDDDDCLYDAFVIEKYLNIIHQYKNQNKYLSSIRGCQKHCYSNGQDSKNCYGFTGNIFNLNIIKLFDISFQKEVSYYEEDSLFLGEYSYYITRLNKYLIKFEDILLNDDIVYVKMWHNDSICCSTKEQTRSDRALKFINQRFIFDLSVPQDDIIKEMIYNNFHCNFDYLLDWIKRFKINKLELNYSQISELLSIIEKCNLIMELYPNLIKDKDKLNIYYNFINEIKIGN